ncbi:hypothetical protein F5I97DRAFT_1874813 [Phlebopus sp. FC_14]|nr:hypothetical protein F5I97DRAFT_1874813 [Phlebopus sp. FC_14]
MIGRVRVQCDLSGFTLLSLCKLIANFHQTVAAPSDWVDISGPREAARNSVISADGDSPKVLALCSRRLKNMRDASTL